MYWVYLSDNEYTFFPTFQDEDPIGASYVVLTIFLAIAFILYYCVAVNYLW